jgi:hypothetical protein
MLAHMDGGLGLAAALHKSQPVRLRFRQLEPVIAVVDPDEKIALPEGATLDDIAFDDAASDFASDVDFGRFHPAIAVDDALRQLLGLQVEIERVGARSQRHENSQCQKPIRTHLFELSARTPPALSFSRPMPLHASSQLWRTFRSGASPNICDKRGGNIPSWGIAILDLDQT